MFSVSLAITSSSVFSDLVDKRSARLGALPRASKKKVERKLRGVIDKQFLSLFLSRCSCGMTLKCAFPLALGTHAYFQSCTSNLLTSDSLIVQGTLASISYFTGLQPRNSLIRHRLLKSHSLDYVVKKLPPRLDFFFLLPQISHMVPQAWKTAKHRRQWHCSIHIGL